MKEAGPPLLVIPGSCSGAHTIDSRRPLVSEQYAGRQIVGMDLHRRRSVLVRMTDTGERLETVRISNDPEYLRQVMARAGEAPEVVLEARMAGTGPPTRWPSSAPMCTWRTRWG
jgi:hypothetical protein